MRLFRLAAVDWFVSFGLRQQLDLCGVPQFFRYDALVQAVHQQIILLWNLMIFVPGAVNLFEFAAAKGDFSAVDGVLQDGTNQCCAEKGRGAILTSKFLKAVGLQIFGKTICTCVRVYILLKNRANGRRFILIDLQLVRKLCDAAVTLDMAGGETGVDSYNVSVAAGILMYNIMQRRK